MINLYTPAVLTLNIPCPYNTPNMITLYTPATGFPDLEVKIPCGLIRTRIKVDDKFKKSKDCMLLFTKKSLCSKKVRIGNV